MASPLAAKYREIEQPDLRRSDFRGSCSNRAEPLVRATWREQWSPFVRGGGRDVAVHAPAFATRDL